tara:strand:- start:2615 stop:3088 length:474 start_codon:yes stop_codon:yes gene_type:complete
MGLKSFPAIITSEELSAMMDLDYQLFDQTPGSGWRKYEGHPEVQIRLLTEYIARNAPANHTLLWHLGQRYAIVGDYHLAIYYFRQALLDEAGDSFNHAWNLYVKGTIAFLTRDCSQLKAHISQLEKLPIKKHLEILYRLERNFHKPYSMLISYQSTS